MTINSYPWAMAPARHAPAAVFSALTDAALVGWQRIRECRRARANYRALGAVSASTLKDIGIDRSEIMSLTLGDSSGRRR